MIWRSRRVCAASTTCTNWRRRRRSCASGGGDSGGRRRCVGRRRTLGIARKYPEPRIYIEGRSDPHRWDPIDTYLEEYDHPLWRKLESQSQGAGHGGMDFIEDYRLIGGLRGGRPLDSDVYDAAMLSAVIELSGRSIARGGETLRFPDFTRGGWRDPRQLQVMRAGAS